MALDGEVCFEETIFDGVFDFRFGMEDGLCSAGCVLEAISMAIPRNSLEPLKWILESICIAWEDDFYKSSSKVLVLTFLKTLGWIKKRFSLVWTTGASSLVGCALVVVAL